jgi:fructokinase
LGHQLRAEVHKLGLSDEFIQLDPNHRTGAVEVTLDDRAVPSYRIVEDVAYDHLQWTASLQQLAERCHAVCFGTLAQRHPVSRAAIQQFIETVRADPSKIVICDINLRPPFDDPAIVDDSLRLSHWVKLNADEWSILRDRLGFAESASIREFRERYHLSLVCVTRGPDGAQVITASEDVQIPGVAVQAIDTVGAGDAFTAGLVTQLAEKRSLAEAVRFANAYAALVATKPGGTPRIDRAEVLKLC